MATYTCDECGARVPGVDLEEGAAVESEGYVYCARCARDLDIEAEEYSDDHAETPAARGINVKLLAGITAGAIVMGTAIGLLLLKEDEPKPRRREALILGPPAQPAPGTPAPVPDEEEPGPAARPEPAAPRGEAVPPPPRATEEPAPGESLLVTGFEEEGHKIETGPAASAGRVRGGAARGEAALRALKRPRATAAADASVRVSFPAAVDLSGHNKLGLWLRSSGVENDFKLALIIAGRRGFVIPSKDPVFSGDWQWFEFLLAGERSSVEGLFLRFNERAEPSAYYVYLDEVRAYEKAGTVAAAPPTPAPAAVPPPETGTVLSAARPGGSELRKYDFDGAKPAEWRAGELAAPGRTGAGKCLRSVVHISGTERYENVRLYFEPQLKVERGAVAFFSYKLENSTRLSVACDNAAKGTKVRIRFPGLKPGVWGTVRFSLTDLVTEGGDRCDVGDELTTMAIFAGGSDPGRKLCVDDFFLAAEEPHLVVAGFEEGLGDAASRHGLAIADSAEAARVGKRGLAVTVKPGDSRPKASRVEFPVAESDLSRFTHVSVWVGGSDFTELRGILAVKTRGGSYPEIARFTYGPEWKRHVFELKDVPLSDVERFAFYINNSDSWPDSFSVHLDELTLHVGPPGPEESAPPPSALAAEAPPAAPLDLSGGGKVLFAHDFEEEAGPFKGGNTTSTDTYRSSRASFKATPDLKNEFYSCRISIDKWTLGKRQEKGILELGSDTIVAFAYYIDGASSLTLMSWFEEKKENFRVDIEKVPQKTWTLAQVKYLDFRSNDSKSTAKAEKGDWPQNLSWMAGKAGTDCTVMIDDVVICNGTIPGDIGKTLKVQLDRKRETNADPRKDGFYMTTEMVDALAEKLKGGEAKAKSLAVLGDRLAASNFFLAPLAKAGGRLDPKEGYKFIPKAALAQVSKRLSSYRKREALKSALKRYHPEVVVILAGYNDLKGGLPADEAQTEYSYICECCLEAGAVPVLITVPLSADARTQAGGLALGYVASAFNTAKTLQVPMVDAHSWLNAEGKAARTFFSTTGLKKPSYDQLNALFVKVYDRLERFVFGREE